MIDRKPLLADLKKQVIALEKDLREQVTAVPEVGSALRAEYDRAFAVKRTAATWAAWRDERVTQAAVAWVLGTVFVRFCEDNGLLPEPFLAAPTPDGLTAAEESQEEFFRQHPVETDRGWLLTAFSSIGSTQAGRLLFDERHNAAYQIPVSHDAAKALIAFWRRRGEDGTLAHDFTDPEWDTRFLGDLYQDLSEHAKKTYALLQTPEFVEEFILDLTLTPAIEEFGYDVVKMIDPTCGSGHFLLGAFHRLLKEWEGGGAEPYEQVRLALDAVHGVDINPFAVAIARFRLLAVALKMAGFATFEEASRYEFPVRVAVGDSLIKHRQYGLFDDSDDLADFRYETEDLEDHPTILAEGKYHVVVGNPPYIVVRDKGLNAVYRELYDACYMQYALSVPFAQRFFELARVGHADGRSAGYVGQITANSFMKREFGRRLIEDFFANRVDLTHVIDTSATYIPGHGTPTVILAGRRRPPLRDSSVRMVLGIRGEPSVPVRPSEGLVWTAIRRQVEDAGSESEWVSVVDENRDHLRTFPWSLTGGGAADVLSLLEQQSTKMRKFVSVIGRITHTGSDDSYFAPRGTWARLGVSPAYIRPLVTGDAIRDYVIDAQIETLFPYDGDLRASLENLPMRKLLWTVKAILALRREPGGTHEEIGLTWYEWSRWHPERYSVPLGIGMAFVATHNHFALDVGEKVFNRSAPAIKLIDGSEKVDYLRLLGILGSSIACFWLKQASYGGGGDPIGSDGARVSAEAWSERYQFVGARLGDFPLPDSYPLDLATALDSCARKLAGVSPANVTLDYPPTRERLDAARKEWESTRARMIALQEELDWAVYSLYGLLDDLRAAEHSVPELNLGERAFEIVLARSGADTEWFNRHGSTSITEPPAHWSPEYRAVVERRIEVIKNNRSIGLIERPECKRRWTTDGWDAMQDKALRDWLLDRCESRDLWFREIDGIEQPRPLSVNQLADEMRKDPDVVNVADIYAQGKDLAKLLAELAADEHVPFLAALRYKDSGLDKRNDWEHVWDLQRQEDAAPDEPAKRRIRDTIPVPPKYGQGDFLKTSYWRNRGKLDVPKERFVSYPGAGRDGDPSLLLGWAGWDHREQAQALATLIVDREQNEGWDRDRLAPLVAGLGELLPWVRQWHGDIDPTWGESPADMYESFHADVANRLHLTAADLAGWRPPKATRGGRGRSAKAAAQE